METKDNANKKSKKKNLNMPTLIESKADELQFHLPSEKIGELPFTPEEYGKRLKEQRKACFVTRKELAATIYCTPEYIRQIEEGKPKTINRDYVVAFAGKLNCTAYYLVGLTDYVDGIYCEGQDGQRLPFMVSPEGEAVNIRGLQRGYARDPELCLLCVKLLKGSAKEREFYKRELNRLLQSKL